MTAQLYKDMVELFGENQARTIYVHGSDRRAAKKRSRERYGRRHEKDLEYQNRMITASRGITKM